MRRKLAITLLFVFGLCAAPLPGDERRAKEQPVGDLTKQLADKDADKARAAAKTLGQLGPAAKDAVPTLKELLKSRDGCVKLSAAEALWRLEHRATDLVPVYSELLTATDANVRAAAAWRLGRLGSHARPAVLLLASALRDERYEVRVQAGQALANLGGFAEPALPALVRALGDERLDQPTSGRRDSDSVKTSPALPALVELADAALPLLIATFRDGATKRDRDDHSVPSRSEVASRVTQVLPAFGGRAVAPLLQALESQDAESRCYAVLALQKVAELNGLPETAVDKLEKCLDDPDKNVRRCAADAMSWVRPSSAKAVRNLKKSKDDNLGFKDDALLADLERMCPHNEAAVDLLMSLLDDKNAATAREAYRIFDNLELQSEKALELWTKALSHADKDVRTNAIWALRRFGAAAKPAKTALRERYAKEDYHHKEDILYALSGIDPDDPTLVSFLMEAMDDRDKNVHIYAVRNLEALGPKAKDAIPKLEKHLFNPPEADREKFNEIFFRDIVDAIVRIAPGSDKSTATLLKTLRDPRLCSMRDPKNTWYMRDVLEDQLQANLPAAAPALREALKDEDAGVRQSAALVLLRAGLETDTALPVLMENLFCGKDAYGFPDGLQRRVVELLMRRQKAVTPAVAEAWCKAWQEAHPKVRKNLEWGLLVLQPEALPHLLEQLRRAKTTQAQRDLAHLLARFEGQGKEVLPILREELRESKPADQFAAARALSALGPDAADAVPELVNMLGHSHPGMRVVAAQTLARIGRAARPAVPALKAMLKEDRPELRATAADALSTIDPDVGEALVVLRDLLVSKKVGGLWRTADIELPEGVEERGIFLDPIEDAIVRYEERAVPILAELLEDVDLDEWSADNLSSQCGADARIQAARLLARIGPAAKAAVPALVRALKDKDPFVRDGAVSALGRIGPAAKEAAPDFITLLEEQNRTGAGAWSAGARVAGAAGGTGRFDYGLFDFRSMGRSHVVYQNTSFGYGFDQFDPYGHVRPAYPYDPAYVLSRIDAEAHSAQPLLNEMAKTPGHPRRLAAALALWRSGCDSPDLLPAFTADLEAHAKIPKGLRIPLNKEVRDCLAELDTQLKPTAPLLAEWVKRRQQYPVEDDQAAVLEALGRLGADARPEADALRPLLSGDRWEDGRRVAVALALFRMTGDKDVAFPVLREVLMGLEDHGSIYRFVQSVATPRVRAARALGVLADAGDDRAVALLLETAKGDENTHVRVAALEALARQKATKAEATKGLSKLLRHPNDAVRLAVASACGRLGKQARSCHAALKQATEDSDLEVRQAARRALELMD